MRSSAACSALESVNLRVATRCCASTKRQHSPAKGFASERSASSVQVTDDIRQPRNGLNGVDRSHRQRHVRVAQPLAGDEVVTTDDGVERAVQPYEKDSELELL